MKFAMKREEVLSELNGLDIGELKRRKQGTQNEINDLEAKIKELKQYMVDIDFVLGQKNNIETRNIVVIEKYKPWRDSATEITISVQAVNREDEGEIIAYIAYRRIQYSDRGTLYSILKMLYDEYTFDKIIMYGLKGTKQIKNDFVVEERT